MIKKLGDVIEVSDRSYIVGIGGRLEVDQYFEGSSGAKMLERKAKRLDCACKDCMPELVHSLGSTRVGGQ